MAKDLVKTEINVIDNKIGIMKIGDVDYISLADLAKYQNSEDPSGVIRNWMFNKISIDCDCDSNPAEPEMNDIGIFASIDPVTLDQCCYDTIINSNDQGKDSLINRTKEKHVIHTVETAYELGIGNREYELIDIDN